MSFRETASAVQGARLEPTTFTNYFKAFYEGITSDAIIWFPYMDREEYELPIFDFNNIATDENDRAIFQMAITPCLLLTWFSAGRFQSVSYEFYYPSVCARQLGFGQLPIKLYFADKVRAREVLESAVQYNKFTSLTADLPPIEITSWCSAIFRSNSFIQWWSEWK